MNRGGPRQEFPVYGLLLARETPASPCCETPTASHSTPHRNRPLRVRSTPFRSQLVIGPQVAVDSAAVRARLATAASFEPGGLGLVVRRQALDARQFGRRQR